jgi:hypothetical protein
MEYSFLLLNYLTISNNSFSQFIDAIHRCPVYKRLQIAPKKKSIGFKSGDLGAHCTKPPRPIHLSGKVSFKNSLAAKLKCGGAPS